MNYNFATHINEYLIRLPSIFAKIHKGTEQNSSRITGYEQNFEQNKRFLRALLTGRTTHFTSRIYPSLVTRHVARENKKKCFTDFVVFISVSVCTHIFQNKDISSISTKHRYVKFVMFHTSFHLNEINN